MTGPLTAGLFAAAVCAVATIWSGLHVARDVPESTAKLARRFASQAGLMMPPDIADWVGGRIRRRALTKLLVLGPVMPAAAFFYFYLDVREALLDWRVPRSGADVLAYLPPLVLMLTGLAAAGAVAAYHSEIRAGRRSGELLADGDPSRGLDRVIPPLITRFSRAAMAAPLAAAAWIAAAVRPVPYPRIWGLAVTAAVSLAVLAWSERTELTIARGPRLGSTAAKLAFDNAFLAQTLLWLARVPAVTALLGTAVTCGPVLGRPLGGAAAPVGSLCYLLGFGAYVGISLPWAGRYFRRYLPASA